MNRVAFNENDPHAAAWLRNLYPEADVIERDIRDVTADDVAPYTRCHYFGGIGGWEEALRLAGWPTAAPVWTGSCPCQPFSNAGQRRGDTDSRHLWPELYRLVRECRPQYCFGEQVASAAGRDWLARVRADLALLGYAVGAADLAAASVGAPHIRQRLYWVAYADGRESGDRGLQRGGQHGQQSADGGALSGVGIAAGFPSPRVGGLLAAHARAEGEQGAEPSRDGSTRGLPDTHSGGRGTGLGDDGARQSDAVGNRPYGELANASDSGRGRRASESGRQSLRRDALTRTSQIGAVGLFQPDSQRCEADGGAESGSAAWAHWASADLIYCRDEKYRRVEPGSFPLVDGVPFRLADGRTAEISRTQALRGIGDAIVPEVAAVFIRAFMEATA